MKKQHTGSQSAAARFIQAGLHFTHHYCHLCNFDAYRLVLQIQESLTLTSSLSLLRCKLAMTPPESRKRAGACHTINAAVRDSKPDTLFHVGRQSLTVCLKMKVAAALLRTMTMKNLFDCTC